MKELTKKVLESGLIDKHVAQMFEKWGQLEPGATELAGKHKVTKDTLQQFADEIEDLLDYKKDIHETRLEVRVKPPIILFSIKNGSFSAAVDELDRLIVSPEVFFEKGDKIYPINVSPPNDDEAWIVLDVEFLYQNEDLVAYQVTVDKPE